MSTLTERVRAAIQDAGAGSMGAEYGFVPIVRDEQAEAAIRELMAAMREWEHFHSDDEAFLDAFASAHGLEPPAEEPQP